MGKVPEELREQYLTACATGDAIWAGLHERVGLCGHCGKRKCLGRKSHSYLPDKVSVDVLKLAMNVALKKMRTPAPSPEPGKGEG